MEQVTYNWVFRSVLGAVKNASDAHPAWPFDRRFKRSIAKRAAGTLTAVMPDALAVSTTPSDQAGKAARSFRPSVDHRNQRRGRASHGPMARALHNRVGALAGAARREGKMEAYEAYVSVLRTLAEFCR